MADIKLKDKVNRLIAVVSLAKDKVDAKATKALDNVTLPIAQAGKALSVSSTGGLTYSTIGSTGSDANKANVSLDNLNAAGTAVVEAWKTETTDDDASLVALEAKWAN